MIKNAIELKAQIALLEVEEKTKKALMIEQFNHTRDNLRPVNLIKNAVGNFVSAPNMISNLLGTSLGIGAGILSKKILVGKSTNIFKKLVGRIVQTVVSRSVAKKIADPEK